MQLFTIKNRKIVLNFIIIIALGLFSGLMLQEKNFEEGILGLIFIATIGVFQNVVKSYKDEEYNKMKILINMFIESFIYIILYGLILFVFKIEIILFTKIIIAQIFLILYCIAKDYITKASYRKQVIFYIIFFSILIGGMIYGLNAKMNFLDLLVYTIAIASSVSALFCTFTKLDNQS